MNPLDLASNREHQAVKVLASEVADKVLAEVAPFLSRIADERSALRDQVEQLRAHLMTVMEAGRKAFLAGDVTPESIAFIKVWSDAIPLVPKYEPEYQPDAK